MGSRSEVMMSGCQGLKVELWKETGVGTGVRVVSYGIGEGHGRTSGVREEDVIRELTS